MRSTSPAAWPSVSFTALKRSRSTYNTPHMRWWRRVRVSAWSSRSMSIVRLGSPVSASCSAWCESCVSNSFCSDRSRTRQHVIGSKPSTTIALVETTIGKVVPSRARPVTSQLPCGASACPAVRTVSRYIVERVVQVRGDAIDAPGCPTISAVVQPKIASAGALNDSTQAVGTDREDSFGRVLDHRAVERLAADRRPRSRARADLRHVACLHRSRRPSR